MRASQLFQAWAVQFLSVTPKWKEIEELVFHLWQKENRFHSHCYLTIAVTESDTWHFRTLCPDHELHASSMCLCTCIHRWAFGGQRSFQVSFLRHCPPCSSREGLSLTLNSWSRLSHHSRNFLTVLGIKVRSFLTSTLPTELSPQPLD